MVTKALGHTVCNGHFRLKNVPVRAWPLKVQVILIGMRSVAAFALAGMVISISQFAGIGGELFGGNL